MQFRYRASRATLYRPVDRPAVESAGSDDRVLADPDEPDSFGRSAKMVDVFSSKPPMHVCALSVWLAISLFDSGARTCTRAFDTEL